MPYKQCITDGSTIRVTASYPHYDDGTRHSGIDTVHTDHKAFAPYGGTVMRAWHWEGGTAGHNSWGNHIVVKFAENQYWLAAHFASQIWSEGDTITQGQYIGEQGATGNVTGIHTHWEYWNGGYSVNYRDNPAIILRIPNAVGTYDVEWDAGGEPPTPPEPPGPGPGPEPGPETEKRKMPIWMLCAPVWRYKR